MSGWEGRAGAVTQGAPSAWRRQTLKSWVLRGALAPGILISLQFLAVVVADPQSAVQALGALLLYSVLMLLPGAVAGALLGVTVVMAERVARGSRGLAGIMLVVISAATLTATISFFQRPVVDWGYSLVLGSAGAVVVALLGVWDISRSGRHAEPT